MRQEQQVPKKSVRYVCLAVELRHGFAARSVSALSPSPRMVRDARSRACADQGGQDVQVLGNSETGCADRKALVHPRRTRAAPVPMSVERTSTAAWDMLDRVIGFKNCKALIHHDARGPAPVPMSADRTSRCLGGRNTSPCTSFHPDSSLTSLSSDSRSSSSRVYLSKQCYDGIKAELVHSWGGRMDRNGT